jgi:hypothetical protein
MENVVSKEIIATWMVVDNDDEASDFPQAGSNSASPKVQEIYWRCVACFFATSVGVGNKQKHVFYTNSNNLPTVDGISIRSILSKLNVEIRVLDITSRLGRDRVRRWNNQFYVLDIIRDLKNRNDFEAVVLLDSDCVWPRQAQELFRDIKKWGILSLCIPYALDEVVNGASRRDMKAAGSILSSVELDGEPYYSGGEFFAATVGKIIEIDGLAGRMWEKLVDPNNIDIKIQEEGQFLSVIYHLLNVPVGTADMHIKRMWTAIRLNTVTWEDIDSSRCIWHLPEEKGAGFFDLFRELRHSNSWIWKNLEHEYRLSLAKTMGLPNRRPIQIIRKVATRTAYKLKSFTAKKFLRR